MLEITVRCRIDEETKEKASLVLDQMGMSLSTAIRLFLKRVAEDGTFPFELHRPAQDDASGIKAALIHMINSGQVSAQAFTGLLGDELKLGAHTLSDNNTTGLPGVRPITPSRVKKVRKL